MKQAEMAPLMGKIVTVHSIMDAGEGPERRWHPKKCKEWAGWIVGFSFKMDGITSSGTLTERGSFVEFSRQLCVMVKSWPTTKPKAIPLDGYTMGGDPVRPDHGGWREKRETKKKKAHLPYPI